MDAVLYLALSIVLTTTSQLFQKLHVVHPERGIMIFGLPFRISLNLMLGISCLVLAMGFWLLTLNVMPVSKAYPLLSLNYVFVLLTARFFFHEPISRTQLLGVGFIMLGITLLSTG